MLVAEKFVQNLFLPAIQKFKKCSPEFREARDCPHLYSCTYTQSCKIVSTLSTLLGRLDDLVEKVIDAFSFV